MCRSWRVASLAIQTEIIKIEPKKKTDERKKSEISDDRGPRKDVEMGCKNLGFSSLASTIAVAIVVTWIRTWKSSMYM